MYNARPKDRITVPKFEPVQRELVFDVDMNDYNQVRTCCKEAELCDKCWKFMGIASQIVDSALREDFGYQHILWIFSGRRGIHCWVCDESARLLTSKNRTGVVEYLHRLVGGTETTLPKIIFGSRKQHSLKRSYKIIEPLFNEIILEDQDLFASSEGVKKLISLVPDDQMEKDLEKLLVGLPNSTTVWNTFEKYLLESRESSKTAQIKNSRFLIEEIKMALCYPRLDINVSKGMNHLLKAPFCIHPSTRKVCVPFHPSTVMKFQPTTVPTVDVLLEEINKYDGDETFDNADQARIKEYKKTSLFRGVKIFEEFLKKLECS